jgi:hypothetical protein
MSSTSFFMSDETRQKIIQKIQQEERYRLLFPGVKYLSTPQSLKITEV